MADSFSAACRPERKKKPKGVLGKFPMTDVRGDPHHPVRLLIRLQATVAGCDWLLKRGVTSDFDSTIPDEWNMADV